MPWTAEEFRTRHAKNLTKTEAARAAKIANAILAGGGDEGTAISTAIKRVKEKPGDAIYGKKK